jgi:predicted outer membrane repeat protein
VANFIYNHAKHELGQGGLIFATHDMRVMFVMTNTTANTEDDVTSISGFTTLDEMDGSGYTRQALTGEAWAKDATNNRSEFDANDPNFGAVGIGTRQVQAAIVYRHITDDTDSFPVAYFDTVSTGATFPFWTNGGTSAIAWNAEGIVQVG